MADPKQTEPEDADGVGLVRVLSSIKYIRAMAHEKRVLLLSRAQHRVNTKKYIYVLSGGLALVSGGAASALVAPAADLIGVKLFAAALAFISGIISLVTSAFFDEKETARINEGAGRYGELRDRADVVLNSRNRKFDELDAAYSRLAEQQTKLQEFDQWIDVTIIQAKSEAIQRTLNQEAAAELASRRRGRSAPEDAATFAPPQSGGDASSIGRILSGPMFSERFKDH